MDDSLRLLIIIVALLLICWIVFLLLSTCMGEPIRHTFDWWWQGLVDAAESRRSRMRYERVPAFGMSQAGEEFEMLDRAARGQSERYY